MTERYPLITLNNDIKMPIIGYGVFRIPAKETANLVETAITKGYRLIDTAAAYRNEKQVGEGIRRSGIDRSKLFVTTKLWIRDFGYDTAMQAFDLSMSKLGLEYLDLYLIHWPVPSHYDSTVASYKAMEKLLADGHIRAIGVSNHTTAHLANLIERTEVVPTVNQVELHPFFAQKKLRDTHAKRNIVTQAWSPIGGVLRYSADDPDAVQNPLNHPTIVKLAKKYGKTPAQLILRWHIEHGISVIPKSVRPERIAENIDIFDFTLSAEDIAAVDALDTGMRGGPDPETFS